MTRRAILRPLASAITLAFLVLAAPGEAQQVRLQEERRFAAFDSNRDGVISREEFEVNKVYALFEPRGSADSGSIDRQIRIPREASRLTPDAFAALDRDGDGVLTGQEVVSAEALRFEAIDRNVDGFIDREEFSAFVRRMFE